MADLETPQSSRSPTTNAVSFRQLVRNATIRFGDRDGEPHVPKATIFHWYRRLGLWESLAQPLRQRYVERLCVEGWSKSAATSASWRMLQDALAASEDGTINPDRLRGELAAVEAYASDAKYPSNPSDDEVAAAIADLKVVFGEDYTACEHLRITIAHFCKRLGFWTEAVGLWLAAERSELVDGKSPEWAVKAAWRSLGRDLFFASTSDDPGKFLDSLIEELTEPANAMLRSFHGPS